MWIWNSSLNKEAALGKRPWGGASLQAPATHQHLALGAMGKEEATNVLRGPGPVLATGLLHPHNTRNADENTDSGRGNNLRAHS